MEAVQDTISQSRDQDAADATPLQRYIVIVGDHANGGSAFRIEDPARLLRVYSLLQETFEQLERATLPPEGMPALQRQLQMIRRETERAVSPSLAAELRRILPSHEAAPSAGALRIECAVLARWVASLIVQMLTVLAAASERSQQVSADHGRP
jgi:proteasome activator-like protein